jgi:hypothetical protein
MATNRRWASTTAKSSVETLGVDALGVEADIDALGVEVDVEVIVVDVEMIVVRLMVVEPIGR